MKIKCHVCDTPLSNGENYSLECEFKNHCGISFNSDGLPFSFEIYIVDNSKEYRIRGGKYGTYLDVKHILKHNWWYKNLIQVKDVSLQIIEGMPQALLLLEKLKTYIVFS